MKLSPALLVPLILIAACNAPSTRLNDYGDSTLLKIAQLRDRRNTIDLIPLLRAKSPQHRTAAAIAFGSICDTSAKPYLFISLFTDQVPEVRSAAAFAIGQLYDSTCVQDLLKSLRMEINASVQKQVMEALGKCANNEVVAFFEKFDQHQSELKEGHALGMFRSVLSKKVGGAYATRCLQYLSSSQSTYNTQFYAAMTLKRMFKSLSTSQRDTISQIADKFQDRDLQVALTPFTKVPEDESEIAFNKDSINHLLARPYLAAALIQSMSATSSADLLYLKSLVMSSHPAIIRTNAADKFFSSILFSGADKHAEFIKYCLSSNDMGLQSAAAIYISKCEDVDLLTDVLPLLKSQLAGMAMPRQMETYIDLARAIAHLSGSTFEKPANPFNHPIDWEAVKKIKKDQQVRVKTSKGEIIIQLNVNDAPGSVWNFINTVDSGHYYGKYFHRVVPNFVIQGGCPRGDGWGAPDWTQRSEFSPNLLFKRGAVGLASVGNDTEGFQIFITHCATPHLDGRYTVFGNVIKGFDVVDLIEVGDIIIEMKLL